MRLGATLLGVLLVTAPALVAAAGPRAPMPVPRPVVGAPVAAAQSAGSLFSAGSPDDTAARVRPAAASLTLDFDRTVTPRAAPARADLPAPPARPSTLTGTVGFIVIDVETGAVLEASGADNPLAPASVAKLPTAVFALDRLGPAHRFETQVLTTGPIRNGVLDGDLVLVGGGEPALDSDALAALAREVATRVQRITGRFLVSHGGWPEIALIDPEQPDRASYNPAIAGLNLNFNRVRLEWEVKGGRLNAGLSAHAAGSSPPVSSVGLVLAPADCGCPGFDHVMTAQGEQWRVRRSLLRKTGSVWLPVREPDRYAGDVFAQAAKAAGLTLPAPQEAGQVRGQMIGRLQGAPLGEQITDMLRFSNNMSAEVIGMAAARASGDRIDTLQASAHSMNGWAARLAGFSARDGGFALLNHSGLSAQSRVTPARMGAFLLAVDRHPRLGPMLAKVLKAHPVEAPEGTRGTPPSARAKTGTMNFTRGLAGYITTSGGRRLAFAYFANDLPRRAAGLDEEGPGQGARGWRNAAVHFERQLLTRWAGLFDGPAGPTLAQN